MIETLDREIRPALRADGGDIELIDVDGKRVIIGLRGACANCPSSDFTLAKYVETKLCEMVEPDLVLEEAS